MSDKSYFLPAPTPEQRRTLQESLIMTFPVIIGGQSGLLFAENQLENTYQCLNVILGFESPTNYAGIVSLDLICGQKSYYPILPMPELTVSLDKWDGGTPDGFMKAAATILSPVVKKPIVISALLGHIHQVPAADGRFHIAIWASPGIIGWNGSKMPNTLWGIPVDSKKPPLAGSGTGIPIHDGDYAVAELVGDTLYVHHDLVHQGSANEVRIFARLLEKVADELTTQTVQARQNTCQNFVQACMRQVESLNMDSISCMQDSQEISQRESAFCFQIRAVQTQEDLIASGKLSARDDLAREFDQLVELSKVRNVEVTSTAINVYTDVLFCRNPRTRVLHNIGAFKIVLNPDNVPGVRWDEKVCVQWFNLTRRVRGYAPAMQAPHVFADGHACLGSMSGIFPKLIRDGNFFAAVTLAIEFIESVNIEDSAGKHITRWPKARKQWPLVTFLSGACMLMLFVVNPQGYGSRALNASRLDSFAQVHSTLSPAADVFKQEFDELRERLNNTQKEVNRKLSSVCGTAPDSEENDNE